MVGLQVPHYQLVCFRFERLNQNTRPARMFPQGSTDFVARVQHRSLVKRSRSKAHQLSPEAKQTNFLPKQSKPTFSRSKANQLSPEAKQTNFLPKQRKPTFSRSKANQLSPEAKQTNFLPKQSKPTFSRSKANQLSTLMVSLVCQGSQTPCSTPTGSPTCKRSLGLAVAASPVQMPKCKRLCLKIPGGNLGSHFLDPA